MPCTFYLIKQTSVSKVEQPFGFCNGQGGMGMRTVDLLRALSHLLVNACISGVLFFLFDWAAQLLLLSRFIRVRLCATP